MIALDGSHGEGGGQILRTAVALSMITGQPFEITRIRAGRPKPGLMRQHLTAIKAAATVCNAQLDGASLGSSRLRFRPGTPRGGAYHFTVGTAGSATLILQTVLPALLTTTEPSSLVLEGGTHNPHAPPFDFLERTFLPLINRMGPQVTAVLDRPGFYPAGGGRITIEITPSEKLAPLSLVERGEIRARRGRGIVARLPRHIAQREIDTAREILDWPAECFAVEELPAEYGPGNVFLLEVECEQITEVFAGFGQRGVPAEQVARNAAEEALRYLNADVPVGEHLADQLLLPLALAGGGTYLTLPLSLHATTNIETIRRFLDVQIDVEPHGNENQQVTIRG